jgi:hypothetical protein
MAPKVCDHRRLCCWTLCSLFRSLALTTIRLRHEPGNFWTAGSSLPTPQPLALYLGSNGTLSQSPGETGSVAYDYDPTDPVQTIGGNNLLMICGPWDQVLAASA